MAGKQAESQHPETRENDVPDRASNSPAAAAYTVSVHTDLTRLPLSDILAEDSPRLSLDLIIWSLLEAKSRGSLVRVSDLLFHTVY
jgi:hypothetical protein